MTKFTRIIQHRRKERFSKPKGRLNVSASKISVCIFFVLILCGFAYLALINNVSTGGFEIKKLEQDISSLKEANRKLELEAADLQSMSVIAGASDQLSLSKVEKVEYLEVTPPYVALGY